MKPRRLSRRTLLRGAAYGLEVSFGLPVLSAMLTSGGSLVSSANAATPFPVRLMTFFFANGYSGEWNPAQTGTSFTLPKSLLPLEPVRQHITVVSGLTCTAALKNETDVHGNGAAAFATGATSVKEGPDGPSIDQVAAQALGSATKFPSINAALEKPGDSPWTNNIAWSAKRKPVPPDRDPKTLFERLAGAGTPTNGAAAAAAAMEKRSVLDFVLADVNRLQARLGGDDRARVDQHLTALRGLERQLFNAPATPTSCSVGQAPTPGDDFRKKSQAFLDLLVLAFQCDLTRVASYAMNKAISSLQYSWITGAWDTDHHHSHDGPSEVVHAITRAKVEQLVYLVQKLAAVPEGTGTLLDNTVVYFSSEISTGYNHGKKNMPVLLAGRAGGKLVSGRHVKYDGTSTAKLLVSLLNYAGVPTQKFGYDGDGPLAGL